MLSAKEEKVLAKLKSEGGMTKDQIINWAQEEKVLNALGITWSLKDRGLVALQNDEYVVVERIQV